MKVESEDKNSSKMANEEGRDVYRRICFSWMASKFQLDETCFLFNMT
jgi:hypothetical protein